MVVAVKDGFTLAMFSVPFSEILCNCTHSDNLLNVCPANICMLTVVIYTLHSHLSNSLLLLPHTPCTPTAVCHHHG